MIEAGTGIQPLLLSSMALYQDLVERETLDCEFETPRAAVCLPVERRNGGVRRDRPADGRGVSLSRPGEYDGDALLELEPALGPAWPAAGTITTTPISARQADACLARASSKPGERRSARIVRSRAFDAANGRALAADTAQGELAADLFVVAAGAWTPLLNDHLGCRVPIQPGKGYSLTMPRPAACPKIPLIFPETRVAVTPFQSGYRLGSTMEFAGYDESIRPERLQLLKDGATDYLQRTLLRAGAGRVVRLAADDVRQPADHRPKPQV